MLFHYRTSFAESTENLPTSAKISADLLKKEQKINKIERGDRAKR
nr:hypothetical protein [Bibersteinia trehalosi]